MGRTRKPAKIRVAEGNRSRTPIPKEIEPGGKPIMPPHLSADEEACWQAVVRSMPPGILTAADTQVCERMSVAWSNYRQAAKIVRESSVLVRGHDAKPTKNPAFTILRQSAEEMERCGTALGLTPASRTKIAAPEAVDDDPLASLMKIWDADAAEKRQH